jgi:mono/diheme cytochrome c family protein
MESWLLLSLVALAGCRHEMYDQPKYEPFEASSFFPDGESSRHLVPGTVARGQLRNDDHFYKGLVNGKPAETFPFPVDGPLLNRGRERFNIFCAPCHGQVGDGQGMIVKRGFSAPPTFHKQSLREDAVGHIFETITYGHGAMYPYGYRVAPRDRWAIIAYIRALQLSQHATLNDVPDDERARLEKEPPR